MDWIAGFVITVEMLVLFIMFIALVYFIIKRVETKRHEDFDGRDN